MKHSRLSMRFKLMLMYMLVAGVVCLSYIPMSNSVRRNLLEKYREQVQLRFEQSAQVLEHTCRQVYNVPDILAAYPSYREATLIKTTEEMHDQLAKLIMTSNLSRRCMTHIPYIDNSFVLLNNSGAVIDQANLYLTAEDFVRYGLAVPDGNVEEIRTFLNSNELYCQFSSTSFASSALQPALLVVINRFNSSVRMGILFLEDTLLNLFQFDSLPEGSGLVLHDKAGELVYSYGAAEGDSFRYSFNTYLNNFTMSLYIPWDYYDFLLTSFDGMLGTTLAAAVVAGLLLSVILTAINYRPVKQLLNLSGKAPDNIQTNEYALLYEHIQSSDAQITNLHTNNQALRSKLRASLFARLLNGSVHTSSEMELSYQLMPRLKEKNVLALIRIVSPEDDTSPSVRSFDFLEDKNVCIYTQQMEYGLMAGVFPAQEAELNRFKTLLKAEATRLEGTGLTIYAGVSSEFSGAEGLYIAHHQAQIALAQQQLMTCFVPQEATSSPPLLDLVFLQRLYELIVAGEGDATEEMLEKLGQELIRSAERDQYIQCCSLIRFTLDSVVADLRLGQLDHPPKSLHELLRLSPQEMINCLVSDTKQLADTICKIRSTNGSKAREKVMKYIRDHFATPGIYADSIAAANGVSANTVYQIARECTGRSLGDYIESLRLDMACQLLITTDLPIMQVSARCGWTVPVSFNRVFKQNFGVSPSQWRKDHAKKE